MTEIPRRKSDRSDGCVRRTPFCTADYRNSLMQLTFRKESNPGKTPKTPRSASKNAKTKAGWFPGPPDGDSRTQQHAPAAGASNISKRAGAMPLRQIPVRRRRGASCASFRCLASAEAARKVVHCRGRRVVLQARPPGPPSRLPRQPMGGGVGRIAPAVPGRSPPSSWIPACAGMTIAGDDDLYCWIPASAGMIDRRRRSIT